MGLSILPPYLALGRTDKSGKVPPSRRLNVGCVGVGGRASVVIPKLCRNGNAIPIAFCDVDYTSPRSEKVLTEFPDVPRFKDFRIMLDKMGDDIDAVIVVTPDHTHFVVAMEAMRRGKHVYVEKPLTHTFREAEMLMQAEKKFKVVTQMGNQGHTSGGAEQFKQLVRGGVIKDIHKIEAFFKPFSYPSNWFYEKELRIDKYPDAEQVPSSLDWDLWCGPAEMKPFNSLYHPLRWRAFYLYGCGIFGDWGAHIIDFVHDFLKLGLPSRVEKVEMLEHNQIIFPSLSKLVMRFPARGNDLPSVDLTWTDGYGVKPEVEQQYWDKQDDGTLVKPNLNDTGSTLLHRRDGKFIVYRGSHDSASRLLPRETMEIYRDYVKPPVVKQNHQENFVQACISNGKTTSPFSLSGELTQLLHLGIVCQYLNESFDFDSKNKKVVGNLQAQAILDGPEPRNDWREYYRPIV